MGGRREKQYIHEEETPAKALKSQRAWLGEEEKKVASTKMVVRGTELDMKLKGRLEPDFENLAWKNKESEYPGSI